MLNTVRVPDKFAPLFEHAQQFVTRYFSEQRSAPERGTLEICGQRYVLVRAASMSVEFYEMVRRFYGEEAEALSVARSLLFDIAHAMGLADARAFAERMEVNDPIARLSAGPVHFAHAGWAFVDISADSNPSPDDDYYLLYDHPYSFESDAWLKSRKATDRPVCMMNAGYSSGWCEHSFGVPLVAVEILCRAKGDGMCRFIMAPPARVDDHIQAYSRRHPELASGMVNIEVPGFFSQRTDAQLLKANRELGLRAQQRAHELSITNQRLERDIDERRRAESALSASMELNERLIEALPGGVVQVSKDGSILRANPEALRILGLGYDQISARYVSDFETETIFEDGSPAPSSEYPVSKAMATGLAQTATTLGVRKPNGEISWAVFRAVPTRDHATQEINGAVVTFFDITERKRFEDKLRHAQKLESLGVLAGGIAHDFNNLLVTILGNTSFAKNLAGTDSRLSPLLDEIEVGARRAAELTKQMLDYSGQGKFRVERLDVPSVIREMGKLLNALIPKAIELHYHFQEGLPSIDGDVTQIRQVIMNLITNAAESMTEGKGPGSGEHGAGKGASNGTGNGTTNGAGNGVGHGSGVRQAAGNGLTSKSGKVQISVSHVSISATELAGYLGRDVAPGSFLCVEVADNGCGMDEDTRNRIFDPFFTTKFQGRGLGMATVLGIIRGHGGAIRIDSRPGAGTRVRVLLPAKNNAAERPESAPDQGTILVVDDDVGVQLIARRALANKGYRVITASNGAEGIRLYEQNASSIRLILMDMTMPQMNGIEALKQIRSGGGRVPVLLSSGYDVDPADTASSEVTGILEKPYGVEELWDAVEKAIHPRA